MATQAEIRVKVRDEVYSAVPPMRPFSHLINGSIADNTTTTIVVDDGGNFVAGDIIEFQDDGEQCLVQSVATNTLTVVRQYNGTTNTGGHSDNTEIHKNPRFTLQQIDEAVTDVILGLEAEGVHAWGTGEITLVAGQHSYDVATSYTDIIDIVAVYYAADSYGQPIGLPFHFYHHLETTDFTGGAHLHVWNWGERVATEKLYFTYRKRIDAVTDILTRQERIVVLGAVNQLLKGKIAPFTHDPGKRTNRTIQPGAIGRDSREILFEYRRLLRAEEARLHTEAYKIGSGSPRTRRASRWRA